jgi:hypothetical protein
MESNISILYNKIDEFIKKYHLNQIIKGILMSLLFIISYILIVSFSEYFLWLSISARTVIFYLSILLIGFILTKFLLLPFLHYFNLFSKSISRKSASNILANHFPDIQDKLINTLELSELSDIEDNPLIIASIDQRIETLKPIPFTLAINYRNNFKYAKYLLFIILFIIGVQFIFPGFLYDGSSRILKHNVVFEKEAPFNFLLLTDNLTTTSGDDFEIVLKIEGNYIPNYVELFVGNKSFLMKKNDTNLFSYTLKNVNNSFNFYFFADLFKSASYTLNVVNKAQIVAFSVQVNTPEYTSIPNFKVENISDITVPAGSEVIWNYTGIHTDSLYLKIDSTFSTLESININSFKYSKLVNESFNYELLPINNESYQNRSYIKYNVSCIPDVYPEIAISTQIDSINNMRYYFRGKISDDYGFTNLKFKYYDVSNPKEEVSINIPINKSLNIQEFFYMMDFSDFNSGDKIDYYFQVWDNDIRAYKSTKSSIYSFNLPNEKELKQLAENSFNSLSSGVDKSIEMANELKNELENMKSKFLSEQLSDWEKQQLMQDFQKKHNDLKDMLQQLTEEQNSKNELLEKLTEQKPEILDKQKQLQDLLESVMDAELEALLEEFNKLKDNFKNDKFFELSEQMKMSYDDLEKQLDKNIELFKRFEVERLLENSIDELKELAKQQEDLKNNYDNLSKDELLEKQNEINDKFNDIKDEYSKALEKNEDLKSKMNLEEFSEEFDEVSETQKNASESIENNKNNQSKDKMQQSSDDMQSLSQAMQQMMDENQQSQSMEDMNNLRQILSNLIQFSFDQENLLSKTQTTNRNNPDYAKLSPNQNLLRDNFKIINDSLYSLASRITMINAPITKELLSIKNDLSKAVHNLEQMQIRNATINQQNIMTSANNLALLIDQILKQMQQAMAQQMSGQQQCQNPNGEGKGQSISDMKQKQQSVKDQLQQMIEQMKQGGEGKGQKPGMGKELSKMLSEQEQHRKMLQDMLNESSFSPEAVKKLKEIERMMQQNENDIINKSISPQTMFRQEQIMTRLLEAENAERQREYDDKRESNEAQELYSDPSLFFKESEINKKSEIEQLEYSNIKLNNFYRKRFDEYIIKINK